MKPSEIKAQTVLGYLRLDGEPDDVSPDTLLAAAKKLYHELHRAG